MNLKAKVERAAELVAARNRAALLEWAATLDPDERALLLEVLTGEDAPPLLSGLSDADLDRMILGGLSDETLWKLLSIAARYALPGHAGRELGSRPGDGYQFEVGGGLVRLSPEYKALVDLKIYLGNHGLNEPPYQGGKNGGTGE